MFARKFSWLLAVVLFIVAAPPASAQSFFLKKGDVVVVMGDSITEQLLYSNYFEIWSQTRFPSYNLVFRNVGIGGDRSTGGNSRFKRDVLAYKPTVLTVDFGMNDGGYTGFTEKTFNPYMKELQGIADQAKAANIRVAWITPQPIERSEPGTQLVAYNETLKKFSEGVGEIAKKNDGLFVDQFTPYLKVMNKAREADTKIRITGGDAVHPGPPGQALMAASILKGMGFPREVSRVSISATGEHEEKNCKVTAIDTKDGVKFQRHDEALPYFPEQAKSILKWTPLLEEMNLYELQVKGLKEGKYEVRLGGKKVAEYSDQELAKGVNLAAPALTTGPIAEQVHGVVKAVDAKARFFHDKIYRGLVLANISKLPEFKDTPPNGLEKRRQELIEERLQTVMELDSAIHKALETRSHLVEIVQAK